MYNNSIVQLIIKNVETGTNLKLGIKQFYIIDPVLFMFLMMDFGKKLEDK